MQRNNCETIIQIKFEVQLLCLKPTVKGSPVFVEICALPKEILGAYVNEPRAAYLQTERKTSGRLMGALVAVVECRICNREVAGSNLSLGYFAPRSTQPSIPPGSVNEYQLRLGRQRQVWLIPIADERVGVQVKL